MTGREAFLTVGAFVAMILACGRCGGEAPDLTPETARRPAPARRAPARIDTDRTVACPGSATAQALHDDLCGAGVERVEYAPTGLYLWASDGLAAGCYTPNHGCEEALIGVLRRYQSASGRSVGSSVWLVSPSGRRIARANEGLRGVSIEWE